MGGSRKPSYGTAVRVAVLVDIRVSYSFDVIRNVPSADRRGPVGPCSIFAYDMRCHLPRCNATRSYSKD